MTDGSDENDDGAPRRRPGAGWRSLPEEGAHARLCACTIIFVVVAGLVTRCEWVYLSGFLAQMACRFVGGRGRFTGLFGRVTSMLLRVFGRAVESAAHRAVFRLLGASVGLAFLYSVGQTIS